MTGPRLDLEAIAVEGRPGLAVVLWEGAARAVGECAPLPGTSPDTLASAAAALAPWRGRAIDVAELLLALPPSARCALEVAAIGLACVRAGRPLGERLGAVADRVPVAELVSGPLDAAAEEAVTGLVARGAHTVKLKLGRGPSEGERLAAIRRRHPGLRLRLDLNRRRFEDVDALARVAPEWIEEPAELNRMELKRSPPIALDESLGEPSWPDLAARLFAEGRLAALVLKPAVLGGPSAVAPHIAWAEARGVRWVVSHAFDGPAVRVVSLALAARRPGWAHGLGHLGPELGTGWRTVPREPPCALR